jgi:hypothetical protein
MPNASINTTTTVKPGFFISVRTLVRTSRTKFSIVGLAGADAPLQSL